MKDIDIIIEEISIEYDKCQTKAKKYKSGTKAYLIWSNRAIGLRIALNYIGDACIIHKSNVPLVDG